VGVNGLYAWVLKTPNRSIVSLDATATVAVGEHYRVSGSVSAGRVDYRQAPLDLQDTDRYLAGVSVERDRLGSNGALALGATAIVGRDEALTPFSPFSNWRTGARAFLLLADGPARTWAADFNYVRTTFDGRRGFFRGDRTDHQYQLTLGVDLRGWPDERWLITPQVLLARANSSVDVFSYDRIEVSVQLRRAVWP
jgi:hypothetical protein